MNRKIEKLSCLTLTLMIILSSAMVLKNATAQARPRVFIDPAVNEFFTDTDPVGTEFTVSVMAADWVAPGVYGYQFIFAFDTSMLDAVSAAIPTGHWFTPVDPTKVFTVDAGTINEAAGTVSFALSLLAPEAAKTGGGVIATVKLKIAATPPAGENLTSLIQLPNTGKLIMVDPTTGQGYPIASFDNVPATFNYASPPLPVPELSVSSKSWSNTKADEAGRLFNIDISIADLPAERHAVGFQFRLTYDSTLIETKPEWVSTGDFFKPEWGASWNTSIVEDGVWFGQLVLPPWPDPDELDKWAQGSGVLATIQFEAIYVPPPAASCDLVLDPDQTLIIDYESEEVERTLAPPGTYAITVAEPPWLSVNPQSADMILGDTLSLNVILNSIDKGFRMVGIEFKVRYDPTLLSTSLLDISEGDFLRDFATHGGTNTFFQPYVQDDYGLIGIIILPLVNGTWPEDVFPEGTGVLATLNFTCIGPAEVTESLDTTLEVYDPLLVDLDAKVIPVDTDKTTVEGKCLVTIIPAAPPAGEAAIDLYTQYPDPYGGQGYHEASDAFAPQGIVKLYAQVTYRGEPVPGKPVTFLGTSSPVDVPLQLNEILLGTNFTNEEGIAVWELNVPAIAPNSNGEIWQVTGSVDIAGNVAEDLLNFFVGWLIKVSSVEILEPEGTLYTYPVLYKAQTYDMVINLEVFTMQEPKDCLRLQMHDEEPLTVVVWTGRDELGVPMLATNALDTPFSVDNSLEPGHSRAAAPLSASISIPAGAFTGTGRIQINVLTDFPANFGVSIAPPFEKLVWIKKAP